MADVLNAIDIADALVASLRHLKRLSFTQIAQSLQEYEVMSKWLRVDKVILDDGVGIRRSVMDKLAGSARHVGLFENDDVKFTDNMADLNVSWRHLETSWPFDFKEKLMNRGASKIQDIIETRRVGAMIDMAEELETRAFEVPAATDDKMPFGLPYWVVYNSTTGFNGGAPSGHTTLGGIDPTVHTTFKNYTAKYTTISESDLLRKMRIGHLETRWRSPVTSSQFRGRMGERRRIYCGKSAYMDFADLATKRNENIGFDLGVEDNQTTFKRHPIVWIPQIDESDFSGPTAAVYMIDHEMFHPVVLRGDSMRETVKPAGLSHDVTHVFVNLTYNFICVNRRTQAVFSTDA